MDNPQGVGAEPQSPRRRYAVEVPVVVKAWVDADDSTKASHIAQRLVLNHGMTAPPGAQLIYRALPPPVECWAGTDLEPQGEGEERLISIFRLCFGHNGPHLDFEPFRSEAEGLFSRLSPSEQVRAYGAFSEKGVSLWTQFTLPRALFGGDWGDHLFCGYDSGRRWDGWACPLLPRHQLEEFVRIQNEFYGGDEHGTTLAIMPDDRILVRDGQDPDEPYYLEPEPCQTVDGRVMLWNVGLGFTWDTYDPSVDDISDKTIVGLHTP